MCFNFMEYEEILKKLKSLRSAKNIEGMARFGIRPKTEVLGISIYDLRKMAKIIGKNHGLALELWKSKIHEARHLASMVGEPEKVNEEFFEQCVRDFDSWDVCDQVCSNLLDKTKFAYKKIFDLAKREREFEKRTAFTMIACLASHDKKRGDKDFIKFFPIIKKASGDDRNFVKKAVNWALRGIGKKNLNLHKEALECARQIYDYGVKKNIKSARWIASDAIRELENPNTVQRIKKFSPNT